MISTKYIVTFTEFEDEEPTVVFQGSYNECVELVSDDSVVNKDYFGNNPTGYNICKQ